MTPKIWNYSGWINTNDIATIKKGIRKILKDIDETVAKSFGDEQQDAYCLCFIAEHLTITVTSFKQDQSSYFEITAIDDERIYEALEVFPQYFDILVNDPDSYISDESDIDELEDKTNEDGSETKN